MASIVIPIGYIVARRAFHEQGVAFGIIAVITAMPECVMDFNRVANDSLATALFSILLMLVIRMFDEPGRTVWSLAYGLTLGLGLLTKAYFLTAIPATALLFFGCIWRNRCSVAAYFCTDAWWLEWRSCSQDGGKSAAAYWNEPALLAAWLIFLVATIGTVALSIRLRSENR